MNLVQRKLDFSEIVKKFEKYCTPRKNITFLRHIFFTCRQHEGESFNDFTTKLHKLALDYEVKELRGSLIRDIVIGILRDKLREKMLLDYKLTLQKPIELGQSFEQTKCQVKQLQHNILISNNMSSCTQIWRALTMLIYFYFGEKKKNHVIKFHEIMLIKYERF